MGDFIFVKIYTSRILCFYKGNKVAVHKRKYGPRKWSIKIAHYTRTLKRKPGALAGSVALRQAEPGLQQIYREHYTGKEKEFIGLLELVGQEGWAKVSEAVEIVLAVSPTHLSTEKILAICKRNDDDVFNHKMDDTLILSKGILDIYSRLLNGSTNKFEQGVPVL